MGTRDGKDAGILAWAVVKPPTNLPEIRGNQFQKFIPGPFRLERPGEGRGGGDGGLFLHPAHHHTHVPGFDDHGYAERIQGFVNGLQDLISKPFLYLKAAGVHIDHAGDFA